MNPAGTSFLVCQLYYGLGDALHKKWSRLEVGDTAGLDRTFTMKTGLIPLPSDHECFQHLPRNQERYADYWGEAERSTDEKLSPYLQWPQLRILPAGGAVKNGAVVVRYIGDRDECVARIHRFEAPGASVPFAGREFSIFHVLPPDLVGKIARQYVATCTVPDGSSVGSGLTWMSWRGASIGWGGF